MGGLVSIRAVSSDFAGISLTSWDLSAKAGFGDRVTFPRQPGSSALGTVTEIVRMTARMGAVSQLRRIVILEGPSLPRRIRRAFLHHQLLLALRDRQTLVAAAVPDVISLRIVDPLLVAFAAVARIQDDVAAAVVQARLVSTDFARLAEHPVLISTLSMAGIQSARFVQVSLAGGRVQAGVATLAEVSYLS